MNERLDRFTKLLKEIFELDKSDLDFGIYRVMNLRKTQIEEFLTQRLPQMVQETLVPFAQGSKEEIRAQMTQIEESVAAMGMTVDVLPDTAPMKQKYVQLKKQLAEGADLSALETDVYSALYSFFNRYYEDGDFISKRRYKEGVYAIPYEGEEVKLYWANQDQYYIKTSENFKDYTFVFDGITVHFRLVDATTEQNNNKESKDSKRTFMLFTEDEENYPGIKTFEYDVEAREIVIRFVYDIPEDKKRKYAEENYDAIQKWILSLRDAELIALLAPIPTGKGKETTTLLEKHLKGYVAKNTFDYFIHKDLRGFLTRELDFFIKSEVMHLEDLDSGSEARVETYLAKVKAIKRVGKIIIDFLAQIEDFQKKLWLKKKFVVETNWCITLDKIDESFWAEIIANKVQIDEWIDMYAIDEAEGWSNPPTVDFLRQNQNLIVDTKHFSNTFKYALLESIPNLDEQTDGLMINGDNYHALNFLQSRYSASIDVAYIDPPYNTDASEILYKNNYKHSSFLTMMDNRLTMAYYSYKYFYSDGYGKDYRIYNLQGTVDPEQKHLYLVGCLLSFYQQMKLFEVNADALREFRIEKPLLVFVGNRVTAPVKSSGLSQAEKDLLTDVEEVLLFLNKFLSNRTQSIEHIRAVLNEDTGLIDASGKELFYQDFCALQGIFGLEPNPAEIFADVLRIVFNTDGNADEPRLRMENIRQVSGEIGLKVGEYGDYFGVINIGDTSGLLKNCEQKGIIVSNEEFVSESLFRNINRPNSNIKMLIGSRKFTEGWNSWRVSTMGLINFAKGEGSQAIQLFGRGVRLKGYNGCLKRSRKLDTNVTHPEHIELLETLTIFGVKAQYMEDFKSYLEQEGAPTNETVHEYRLPVISRFDEVKGKKLHVIKVKNGANFKQQAARLILDKPDQGFLRYLLKSKTVIDCRSKIQTIDSTYSFKIESMPEPRTLPADILPLLDVQRIFEELQEYKSEKRYFNISIVKDKLLDILREDGWYGLLIPQNHLKINSIAKLEAATDYAVMALKSYMDKFFKYEKERWEAPRLEYAILDADDSNFVDEYTLTYAQQSAMDPTGDELEAFVAEMSAVLQANNGLDVYKKDSFHGKLVLFDFRSHLYAPLICLEKSNLKIQLSPVALNTDEMRFVDYLKAYVDNHAAELVDKSLYLLRNKSKVGMGFFEAGNFYPDYILWIDTPETQYISFIDPKGLMHIRPDDPKIEFYKTIKDLETRLSPTADGKRIVLNSFIMAGTRSSDLRMWWSTPEVDADRAYREARNVYTLDNDECVESMMRKILQ